MSATNGDCPPPCSTFDSYGFGVWSEESWDAAKAASKLFSEPYKSRWLELCSYKGPDAAWCFVLVYQNPYSDCINVTVAPSLWDAPFTEEVLTAAEPTEPIITLSFTRGVFKAMHSLAPLRSYVNDGEEHDSALGQRGWRLYCKFLVVLYCIVTDCLHFLENAPLSLARVETCGACVPSAQ